MSRPRRPRRLEGIRRASGAGVASLLLMAAPAVANDNSLYPPFSLFRSLQLTALACGRDNDAVSCDKARAMADPLLDHQRLSATCKDTLWAIRQNARSAPANSPERRESIDRPARDVTVFCRQPTRPTGTGGPGKPSPSGGEGASPFFSAPAGR